jgi:hypothetical protein
MLSCADFEIVGEACVKSTRLIAHDIDVEIVVQVDLSVFAEPSRSFDYAALRSG